MGRMVRSGKGSDRTTKVERYSAVKVIDHEDYRGGPFGEGKKKKNGGKFGGELQRKRERIVTDKERRGCQQQHRGGGRDIKREGRVKMIGMGGGNF